VYWKGTRLDFCVVFSSLAAVCSRRSQPMIPRSVRVAVHYGTLVWPGDVDIAPETLIWDGPTPLDEATRRLAGGR